MNGRRQSVVDQRWQDDPLGRRSRPQQGPQRVLLLLLSRLDIHLANGKVWDCEDLRDGCSGMVPESDDGFPGTYSYLKVDTSPDGS